MLSGHRGRRIDDLRGSLFQVAWSGAFWLHRAPLRSTYHCAPQGQEAHLNPVPAALHFVWGRWPIKYGTATQIGNSARETERSWGAFGGGGKGNGSQQASPYRLQEHLSVSPDGGSEKEPPTAMVWPRLPFLRNRTGPTRLHARPPRRCYKRPPSRSPPTSHVFPSWQPAGAELFPC